MTEPMFASSFLQRRRRS